MITGVQGRLQGDYTRAIELYEAGLALYRELEDTEGIAWALMTWDAWRAIRVTTSGRTHSSRRAWRSAGNWATNPASPPAARAWGLWRARSSRQQPRHGCGGAAAAIGEGIGGSLSPADRLRYEHHVTTSCSQLDEGRLAGGLAAGRAESAGGSNAYAVENQRYN